MSRNQNNKYYVYSSIICILGCIVVFFVIFHLNSKTTAVAENVPQRPTPINPFSKITIVAQAAIVYDSTNNKILYEKNADVPLPLASLTKIMTAITATTLAPTSTVITIKKQNLDQAGDTGLYLGEKWTLEDLLKFSLVVSSNDGADAVATSLGSHDLSTSVDASRQQFINDMNKEATILGLQHASFYNATGLDLDTTHAGARASAYDYLSVVLPILATIQIFLQQRFHISLLAKRGILILQEEI